MPSPLPIGVSDASGVPYYRQIVDQVGHLVAAGRLEPGSALPSVRELAAQLLVSLITVRRAYAELEAAGLIERRQGAGTFVTERVQGASRNLARREAYKALGEALERARELGIDDDEIRTYVLTRLDRPSSRPWRL